MKRSTILSGAIFFTVYWTRGFCAPAGTSDVAEPVPTQSTNSTGPASEDVNPDHRCFLPKDVPFSPDMWKTAGMDDWLVDFAKSKNIYEDQENFTANLMAELGWQGYGCTQFNSKSCNSDWNEAYPECANWVNRQIVMFMNELSSKHDIFTRIQEEFNSLGQNAFDVFWADIPPDQPKQKYNWKVVVQDYFSWELSALPIVGSVVAPLEKLLYDATIGQPKVVYPVLKEEAPPWAHIEAAIGKVFTDAVGHLEESPSKFFTTNALFNITKDGRYFVQSQDLQLPEELWGIARPYFTSKVVMTSLQTQQVFLLRVDPQEFGLECGQNGAVAQKQTKLIDDVFAASAFCGNQGRVLIPIVGGRMRPYNLFSSDLFHSVDIPIGSLGDFADPSLACQSEFGPMNRHIAPYVIKDLPFNQFATSSVDMSTPCLWNLPVCDYDAWVDSMLDQGSFNNRGHSKHISERQDMYENVAKWCAYNLGMSKDINYCDTRKNQDNQPDKEKHCDDWHPARTWDISDQSVAYQWVQRENGAASKQNSVDPLGWMRHILYEIGTSNSK